MNRQESGTCFCWPGESPKSRRSAGASESIEVPVERREGTTYSKLRRHFSHFEHDEIAQWKQRKILCTDSSFLARSA